MHHESDHLQNSNNYPKMASMTSWHPHVYANPPKQPTPHFIIDILGIRDPHSPLQANLMKDSAILLASPSHMPVTSGVNGNSGHFYQRAHVNQHFPNSCGSSSRSSCSSNSPSMAPTNEDVQEPNKTVIEQPLNLSCSEKVRGETPSPGKLNSFKVLPRPERSNLLPSPTRYLPRIYHQSFILPSRRWVQSDLPAQPTGSSPAKRQQLPLRTSGGHHWGSG
ncbi:uncharacterized protein CEXT_504771 [Caerostris extrusa]|uniref:Uncharacterized protein n=1 Tax=Caerostris extrusa TaxID=172846 RepID=A0AAV4TVK2_CAEEX|nr:uncharacterized protein CEXT_504771 [Caerostris extrusa]